MDYLSMQFLVATPQLHNTYFERSVILITDHNDTGAMGLVLNKPGKLEKDEIFDQLKLQTPKRQALTVSSGGPVAVQQGFILHSNDRSKWSSTVELNENICLTTSLDVLDAYSNDEGPDFGLLALGYSGWGAGQLEQEMAENAWLSFPFDMAIVAATEQANMLERLTEANGVHYNHMVSSIGHA